MSLWNEKEAKRDHACLTSTRKGGWESLEICHVFADSIVFQQ